MVVAALITNMTFQIRVNPPGGVWQDDNLVTHPTDSKCLYHKAGTSVMSIKQNMYYNLIQICGAIRVLFSLTVVVLVLNDCSSRQGFDRLNWHLVILEYKDDVEISSSKSIVLNLVSQIMNKDYILKVMLHYNTEWSPVD